MAYLSKKKVLAYLHTNTVYLLQPACKHSDSGDSMPFPVGPGVYSGNCNKLVRSPICLQQQNHHTGIPALQYMRATPCCTVVHQRTPQNPIDHAYPLQDQRAFGCLAGKLMENGLLCRQAVVPMGCITNVLWCQCMGCSVKAVVLPINCITTNGL